MHGLKSTILAIFQKSADWLDWVCPVSAPLIFLFYETIIRSSNHRLVIQIQIQNVFCEWLDSH
jgi:hypothetical protein